MYENIPRNIRLLNRKIENRLNDKTRRYNAMQMGDTLEAARKQFFLGSMLFGITFKNYQFKNRLLQIKKEARL